MGMLELLAVRVAQLRSVGNDAAAHDLEEARLNIKAVLMEPMGGSRNLAEALTELSLLAGYAAVAERESK